MKIQEHHDRILRQTMNFLNGSSQNDSVLSKAFSATHLRESNEKWVTALPSLAYWNLHFDSINYMREVNDLFQKKKRVSKRTQKAFNHFKTCDPNEASLVVGMS